jgi:frataxin
MALRSLFRVSGYTVRRRSMQLLRSQMLHDSFMHKAPAIAGVQQSIAPSATAIRSFHPSKPFKGIMPDSEDPPPKQSEGSETPTVPTDISTSEYNQRADDFLNELVTRLEAEQEKRPDVEVEYSVGHLPLPSLHSKY